MQRACSSVKDEVLVYIIRLTEFIALENASASKSVVSLPGPNIEHLVCIQRDFMQCCDNEVVVMVAPMVMNVLVYIYSIYIYILNVYIFFPPSYWLSSVVLGLLALVRDLF